MSPSTGKRYENFFFNLTPLHAGLHSDEDLAKNLSSRERIAKLEKKSEIKFSRLFFSKAGPVKPVSDYKGG